MPRLFAVILKEVLLLCRDRTGLLLLFAMPALLVVIVCVVQENIYEITGENRIKVLYIDHDRTSMSQLIEQQMTQSGSIEIIKELGGNILDEKAGKEAVAKGDYPFLIVIPKNFSKTLKSRSRALVKNSLPIEGSQAQEIIPPLELGVYVDLATRDNISRSIMNSLNMIIHGLVIQEKAKAFSRLFPEYLETLLRESGNHIGSEQLSPSMKEVDTAWLTQPLLTLKKNIAAGDRSSVNLPTSTQQNVPAWALFGIFFIVVPLAGSLIHERQNGIQARLLTMSVSPFTLLFGKIVAYTFVCLAQFAFILIIGKWLLPYLGPPPLDMGSDPYAVIGILVVSSLAATGYGILLGTVSKTYEQTTTFGPISVVIAAAIGGIMVPVYAMPNMMQKISVISPMSWGLNAFLDVFVRGGTMESIILEVILLALFFIATIFVSCIVFAKRNKHGL